MLMARVRRRDDNADRFLVETFEASVPLKIFEVTAQRAFLQELIELVASDEFR